jgi:hypothetical protein
MNHITTEAIERLNLKLEPAIDAYNAAIDNLRALPAKLQHLTHIYRELGVARFSTREADTFEQNGIGLRSYFKELSSAAGRPHVVAEEVQDHWAGTYIHLQLPSNKRTSNLIAGLLLVTEEKSVANAWALRQIIRENQGKALRSMAGGWHFYFIGAGGISLFNSWLQQCASEPVFRVILKPNQ